jgi:hypothetical protein
VGEGRQIPFAVSTTVVAVSMVIGRGGACDGGGGRRSGGDGGQDSEMKEGGVRERGGKGRANTLGSLAGRTQLG